jgi:Pyridine nucleotide-disulphide oxidoreductase
VTQLLERPAFEAAADEGDDVPSERAQRPAGFSAPPHVVVVGGGAAGLELVTRLGDRLGRRGRATITLVDCARVHLWKPLLHEVAAGSPDPGEYEVNYLAQAHWHGFHIDDLVGHGLLDDQFILGVDRDLHVVANADLRMAGHRPAVGIGQRYLAFAGPLQVRQQ